MGDHDHSRGVAECQECQDEAKRHLERADIDDSPWDGPAAMGRCAAASNPATAFAAVCAGRKSGDPKTQAAWALAHHKEAGGPPNAAGVQSALGYLSSAQGLTNTGAARKHLEAHQAAIEAARGKEPPDKPEDKPEGKSEEGAHEELHAEMLREAQGAAVSEEDGHVSNEPCRPRAKDNLYRAVFPGVGVRDVNAGNAAGVDSGKTPDKGFTGDELTGHFAVFRQWTEIDSIFEGRFLESIEPGAFKKTIQENKDNIRCLFQHGRDYRIGDKPLGPIKDLREDDVGAAYTVPMLDTVYNHELIPGLREGLYGASFRFRVTREEVNEKPGQSARNPEGIPERTIKELELKEFGPVTFPAYKGATAGVRSITDEMLLGDYMRDPDRLRELIRAIVPDSGSAHALLPGAGTDPPPDDSGSREEAQGQPGTGSDGSSPPPELVVTRNPNKKSRRRVHGNDKGRAEVPSS